MRRNLLLSKKISLFQIIFVIAFVLMYQSTFAQTSDTFTATTTSTFTVPPGVTGITVEAWGGGAGGTNAKGYGGGGGAYSSGSIIVTAGASYTVTVGNGGGSAGNGANSIFGSNLVVAAGAIGQTGGLASSSIGTIIWSGGSGGDGGGSSGGGGGGSAFITANGNNGATGSGNSNALGGKGTGNGGFGGGNNGNGNTGGSPGGGGGGGGNSAVGGSGANGQIIVSYFSLTSTSVSGTICTGSQGTVNVSGTAINLPVGDYTVTYDLGSPNASTNNTTTMGVLTAGSGTFTTISLANSGSTTITITSIEKGIYKTRYNGSGSANNKAVISVSALLTAPSAGNNSKTYTGVANTTAITATSGAGERIDWYLGLSGGIPLATGTNSYTPSDVNSGTYTYYAEAINTTSGCKSIRTPVTLTINKANLTITAGNQSVTYGTNAATITQYGTYSISGYVNDENSSVISGLSSISYNTNYTSTTNAGSSGINIIPVVSGLTAANYNFIAAQGAISITKANQYINFSPLPATKPLKEFSIVPLDVTSSSGLSVTLTLGSGSAATLNGPPDYNLTNIGETGFVTINATQTGNANYNAATLVSLTFDVTKNNQEINFPGITGTTYSSGLTLSLSAVATSGLNVAYTVVSGPATVSGNTLIVTGAGTITVKASQAGNATYNAAADLTQNIVVGKGTQTIIINVPSGTLTSSSQITATSTSGLPVTLTLGSGSAATSLNYNSGGGYYTLAGIGSGQIYIVGNQSGDDNFLQADQVIQTIDLNKQNQTISFTSIGNKTYGDSPFTLAASASSGLSVSYTVVSGPAIVSSNTLTINGAGTVIVKADQSGNATWNPAPTVTQQFEVYKATPVITQADITKNNGDASFLVLPTSTSTGAFTFTSSNTNIFMMSGNTASIIGAGSVALTITQQPTTNYLGITKTVSFIVNKASSSISVTGSTSYTYNGNPQGPATSTVTGSTGAATYSYSGTGATTYGPTSMPPTNAGSYSVMATVEADNNYSGAISSAFLFDISKANPNISVTPYNVTYDATAHTANGSAHGVKIESLAGLVLSTTHTNAGTYNSDSWTFTDVTGNYNNASGTVTDVINAKALTITASDKSKVYDGAVFSPFTVAYNGFVGGENASNLGGTLAFSGTATTAVSVGANYVIHPDGLTSSNYTISFVDGTLVINPAPLTIVADNQSKCYGETFIFHGTEFTSGGLKNGETIGNVTFTSSGATSGVGAGSYSIVPSAAAINGTFNPGNYSITYSNGTMTVKALPTVSITGNTTICENGTTTLSPITGGSWVSNNPDVAIVSNSGVVTGVLAGSTTFTFIETSTGCRNTTSPVTVNPLPTPIISGSTTVCASSTGNTYSTPLVTGHSYSWTIFGGTIVGSTTGNSITVAWGTGSTGWVKVTETINATTCAVTTAQYDVTINALPTTYTVTGGGTYCSGGSGVVVGLSNSQNGVNYQLYNGTSPVGAAVPGTGSAITFDNLSTGIYTVVATLASGDCPVQMTGSAIITVGDNVSPVITKCLPDGTAGCVASVPAGIKTISDFLAAKGEVTDNCAATNSLTVTFADVIDPNSGCKLKRTYTIADISGNKATCIQLFTITDTEVPIINSVENLLVSPNDNSCGASLNIAAPTDVNENCSLVDEGAYYQYTIAGTTKTGHGDISDVFPEGTTIITWTIADVCGHVSLPKTQTVEVGFNMTAVNYDDGSSKTGLGSGVQPMQTSTHVYFVDNKIPESGYIYSWGLYADNGGVPGAAIDPSLYILSNVNQAHVQLAFKSNIPTNNYIISVIKTKNATTCTKQQTIQIAVKSNSSFEVVLDNLDNQCQAPGGGLTTISWNVTFPNVITEPYMFSYSVKLGGTVVASGNVANITYAGTLPMSGLSAGAQTSKSANSWAVVIYYSLYGVSGNDLARTVEIEINATDAYQVSEPNRTNNIDDLKINQVPVITFE